MITRAFQLGVALPSWLIEQDNANFVLLVYCLIFGILLPVVVARWWNNAKDVSKNNILNSTMALFYRDLRDDLNFKAIMEILTHAPEFHSVLSSKSPASEWEQLANAVKAAVESQTSDKFEPKSKKVMFIKVRHP